MAELATSFFINQANSFISEVQNTKNAYYIFASRAEAWPDEQNPPASNNSIEQVELSAYKDLLFGKLLSASDVQALIPRYTWIVNTVYDQYDQDDSDLYSKQFFVVNDQFQVYKCLFNNGNRPSTVQPRLIASRGSFRTADGYIWKYMFTVDAQANTKFTSIDYIPVRIDPEVSGNAVSGTIDAYKILDGGSGYKVYESGFIFSIIDPFTIQLPSTSSANDNFYARSSIYLRSGFGAGQIREITSYNGATKQLRVSTSDPLDTFVRLDLPSIPVGTVTTGYFVDQSFDRISYTFISNGQSFSTGTTIIQSDTGASGIVLSANSSILRIARNTANSFVLDLAIRDASNDGTARSGTVTIIANTTNVVGDGTTFANASTGYTVDSYIRVGPDPSSQIRRVTSITNNTVLTVNSPFTQTRVANGHFFVPIAATPNSLTVARANGTISNTNLNSLRFDISNNIVPGINFIIGEQVTQVDVANTYLGANAIVAFSNSSTMFLSNVTGPWVPNQFILGSSSLQKATIGSITGNPNITLRDPQGEFVLGFPINFRLNALSNTVVANSTIQAITKIPNDQTEYLIAPTVNVIGDGRDAKAIAIVNTAPNSFNEIVGLEVIDPGEGYTTANVEIYANTSFGSGASTSALISPVNGHGSNPIYELGSRYVGVSTIFDTAMNEGYFFPTYGSYRRFGILENPEFADVRITLDNFDRVNLQLINKSTVSSNASITDFVPGEVVYQPTTNAAGLYVSGNSTVIQLKSVLGTFSEANVAILGVFSNTVADVISAEVIRFRVTSDSPAEIVSQLSSGAKGEVIGLLSNTEILMSNVVGKFAAGDTLVDNTVNAYAVVTSIATSNGSRDVTSSFGLRFNQTMRLTLSSNVGAFSVGETVTQSLSNASAVVISNSNDVDLGITIDTGSFAVGQIVSSNNGAGGYVTFANSTYLKLTGILPTQFEVGNILNNSLNANATIDDVRPVLVMNDVRGTNRFQPGPDNIIRGQTSGAEALVDSFNLIDYPELVRESGRVLYVDNVQPVTRSIASKEDVRLVIRF